MKQSLSALAIWLLALGIMAAVVGVMVVPRQFRAGPKWHIQVKDDEGKPVADVHVVESWVDWTFDSSWHEEGKNTDASGTVIFEERVRRYAPIRRYWHTVTQFLRFGFHGNWGAYTVITADGRHLYADTGQAATHSVLVLQQR